ncbi:MAG: hypothetical protein WAV78_35435, partial [Xanthobacteraceae bacterium]
SRPPPGSPDQVGVADLPLLGGGIAELAAPLSPYPTFLRSGDCGARRLVQSWAASALSRLATFRARVHLS